MNGSAKIASGHFMIDGRPVQLISGALHYFRVPREYWRDRIAKAKMLGLNCIETYMPWNLHELKEDRFDFTGMLDIEAFLKEIQAAGLYAIVRPGPYICAEWDNGGLPAWLMTKSGLEFRRMNGPFLDAVRGYYDQVLPRLKPLQRTHGGPIVAIQVENEYGSYCCDHDYIRTLYREHLRHGIDVVIFTSDGASPLMLNGGTIPECFQTVNFGSKPEEQFAESRLKRPEGPDLCMEFWNGWFDHWGEEHHTRDGKDAAEALDAMLKSGAGVNFYMYHGGTNFGFFNGANGHDIHARDYAPTVTSYDYDSALSECGDATEKYYQFQEVIRRYRPDAPFGRPETPARKTPGRTELKQAAPLLAQLDKLSTPVRSVSPLTLEALGESFGFVHYRTRLAGTGRREELRFFDVHDRVQAFLNGRYLGAAYRNDAKQTLEFDMPEEDATLDLLVENMGHINYGPWVGKDFKGVVGAVCLGLQSQINWENRALPLDDLSKLEFAPVSGGLKETPAFYRGSFECVKPTDCFLARPGVKGAVWINGRNLGRYWEAGPTKTLYVPGCWLRDGVNEIVVLELHQLDSLELRWSDRPDLG